MGLIEYVLHVFVSYVGWRYVHMNNNVNVCRVISPVLYLFIIHRLCVCCPQTEGVRVSVDVLSLGLESPFLFVVRQKQAVLSFQVPLILRGL